jgi:hypothetical protein
MNTAAAAAQANVTAATIRTWCRRNVITAIKQAGRWVIDAASLARRIQIGARRVTQQPTKINDYLRRSIARARYEYTPYREDRPALAGRYVIAYPFAGGTRPSLPGVDVWREYGLLDEVTVGRRRYYVLSEKAVQIRSAAA